MHPCHSSASTTTKPVYLFDSYDRELHSSTGRYLDYMAQCNEKTSVDESTSKNDHETKRALPFDSDVDSDIEPTSLAYHSVTLAEPTVADMISELESRINLLPHSTAKQLVEIARDLERTVKELKASRSRAIEALSADPL